MRDAKASDVQTAQPPVEWLWTHWLPRRHISLITGSAGSGKSLIVLDWLSRWLLNRPMPDGQFLNRQKETAVLCVSEDFLRLCRANPGLAGGRAMRGKTGIYLHRQLHKSKEYHLNNQTAKLQLIDFAAGQEQDRLMKVSDSDQVERKKHLRILSPIKNNFAHPDPIGVWFRPLHSYGVRIEYCCLDLAALVHSLNDNSAVSKQVAQSRPTIDIGVV